MSSDQTVSKDADARPILHTPGPWLHGASAGHHDFIVYSEATGRDVALVRDFNEPNAHLVSTAPETLEALEMLVNAFNVREIDPLQAFAARYVIANARGQS